MTNKDLQNDEENEHKRTLLNTLQERRRLLEEQKAHFGKNIAPHILIELAQTIRQIDELRNELNLPEPPSQPPPIYTVKTCSSFKTLPIILLSLVVVTTLGWFGLRYVSIIFSDTFDRTTFSRSDNLGLHYNPNYDKTQSPLELAVEDGNLVVQVSNGMTRTQSMQLITPKLLTDFDIIINTEVISGEGYVHVRFRGHDGMQETVNSQFSVPTAGNLKYFVSNNTYSKEQKHTTQFSHSEQSGIEPLRRIQVRCTGRDCKFYINDIMIAPNKENYVENDPFTTGFDAREGDMYIGFSGNMKILIKDVEIRDPKYELFGR